MGLDVYLRKCPDLNAALAAQKAFEAETEPLWADDVPEDTRESGRLAAAERHGTDNWGSPTSIVDVSHDSTIDPEHYFKVGYFRSSYNESGIDSVLRRAGLPTLYDVFAVGRDHDYHIRVDWAASLARCDVLIVRYETFLRSDAGKYQVSEVRPMYEYGAKNEKEALDLFLKETASKGSFSNRDGEFFMEGLTLRAVITKKYDRPTNPIEAFIGQPKVFLVYDRVSDGKENWHLTALRIVRETIEYVLSQPDSADHFLAWSA